MTKTPSRDQFEVHLGRMQGDPGDRRLPGFLKTVANGAKHAGRRSGHRSSTVARTQFQRRVIVKEMESDLGTKLDWGAANHFDTDQPHTHLVIRGRRDDGADLVMPRRYITRGIRERAQDLVTLELGPVTEIAGRVRLAKMIGQERWTELDTAIERMTTDDLIDLYAGSRPNQTWRQQLYTQRLKRLSDLNLTVPQAGKQWRVHADIKPTSRRMGSAGISFGLANPEKWVLRILQCPVAR